jgi:hypothetical protein
MMIFIVGDVFVTLRLLLSVTKDLILNVSRSLSKTDERNFKTFVHFTVTLRLLLSVTKDLKLNVSLSLSKTDENFS